MRRTCVFLVVLAALTTVAGAQTLQPMSSGVVPVVAHLPGKLGSYWTTSMYIRQAEGTMPGQVAITIHNPAGPDWGGTVKLPAAEGTLEVKDVVKEVAAAIPDGKYVLTWWSTQPVVLTTRTFTTEASGTYGQGVASVAPNTGFMANGEVIFPAPMDYDGHRVAVGISNSGGAVQTFDVSALDEDGSVVNTWTRTVAGGAIDQFEANGGMSGPGSLSIKCTAGCNGTAYAYSSVVANDSNDAYFMYAGATSGSTQYTPIGMMRDDRGVWFIYGGSPYDVFEQMGYMVASDRLWQAELYRRSARGTMAAVFGSDFLNNDIFMRIIGYTDAELQAAFNQLPSDSKTVIQAYVDGFNRRIAEVRSDPSQLPFEFKAVGQQLAFNFQPADWTVEDVLAWLALLQRNFDPEALDTGQLDSAAMLQAFSQAYPTDALAMFSDLRWMNDPDAQTMIPPPQGAAVTTARISRSVLAKTLDELPPLQQADTNLRNRLSEIFANLKKVNARVKMGSYAWVVSGSKTASGHPILYSGPQMGFTVPSITLEGSIHGGGMTVSGMTVAGVPGIIIGRTPHHAWSMQVGHAHTLDYYLEAPQSVTLDRMETIHVAGAADVTIPVFKSAHGPIIEPIPYNPASPPAAIVSWDYAQRNVEFETIGAFLDMARAQSVASFGNAIEHIGVSQHFCYADKDGNIAYWMSGIDPVRADGTDPRLPLPGDGQHEWKQPLQLKQRAHDENTYQGYYGGWNNKAAVWYNNPPNALGYTLGPAHRAHVIKEYLDAHNDLTFEQVRDLALNIATTDSFAGGGNPWEFVANRFEAAVASNPTTARNDAVALLDSWDGHFVQGGQSQWVDGLFRADAWVLQDQWIREVLRLTFEDEFAGAGMSYTSQPLGLLFNVLLHALEPSPGGITNQYDWFQDVSGSGKPTNADGIIVMALDNVLAQLGPRPWAQSRGFIRYNHDLLGEVHATPFASRSTYAHVVEFGSSGPLRIESMFPLGESGTILMDQYGAPQYDKNFFSMAPIYDAFAPRTFPLFN
ncbi:MAG: penicillin acylase family protein [Acidobacteria bacterium]|nr:penicillin acylase family protein [Acidobacteriota bacterium]